MYKCGYCNREFQSFDLRPYGENRKSICFDCFENGSQSLKDTVEENLSKVLSAVVEQAKETGVVVFTEKGPVAVKSNPEH